MGGKECGLWRSPMIRMISFRLLAPMTVLSHLTLQMLDHLRRDLTRIVIQASER